MKMIKKKAHEKLSDDNIQKVIGLLRQENPITKKEACEILNIRYNTTRLQNIIDDYEDTLAFKTKRKDQLRGKPASEDEIKSVVQSYIEGENISTIATDMYRSPAFVKNIINRLGVPQKQPSSYNRKRDILIPEQCITEEFQVGERVWAAKDNNFAEIIREDTLEHQRASAGRGEFDYQAKYGAKVYHIYVFTPCDVSNTYFPWLDGNRVGYHSFALAYDLGSLKHLEKYL